MSMPNNEQIHAYVGQLPEIYRYVLEAFAKAVPGRRSGSSLHSTVIAQWVILQDDYYQRYDVSVAIDNLIEKKILKIESEDDYNSIAPTELGERIISTMTGISPPQNVVPALPAIRVTSSRW